MERIRWLLRLGQTAAFGAGGCQRLISDDRVVTSAALVSTLVAAWRVSVVIGAPAASPGAAPAPAAVSQFAPAPRLHGPDDAALAVTSARAEPTAKQPRAHPPLAPTASPSASSDEVRRAVDHLVGSEARRANFEAALGRMSVYGPFIRATLRDQGVPQDLLYLPVIESAYRPGAVSRAGATGMWQFMRATGAMYGLEVSAYVDERRDPVRSTQAAVRHLHDLYREFGSWHLALAAYNAGSPRVRRALRRHAEGRTGDERLYWRIRPHLASETRAYVPLFLAAAEIGRRPVDYGLHPAATTPLNFREVWYPGGTRLAHVAHALGLSADQVIALNPHLVRGMTPPGRAWPVRVPPPPTPSHGTGAE